MSVMLNSLHAKKPINLSALYSEAVGKKVKLMAAIKASACLGPGRETLDSESAELTGTNFWHFHRIAHDQFLDRTRELRQSTIDVDINARR